MSAKTKIMVVKKRELIYTGIFLALIILLITLLILMFSRKSTENENVSAEARQTETSAQTDAKTSGTHYISGIYTSPITLGDAAVDVEVTVNKDRIDSIRLVNLSESVSAMYPLVSPSLDDIAKQICETQSLENITCAKSNQYTAQMLLDAVAKALRQAKITE